MANNIISTEEFVDSLMKYNNPAAYSEIPAVNNIMQDYNLVNSQNNDNLMKSYYLQSQSAPAQSGGWWESVKNFAGTPWGRTALSSLGTGLAVGLSGGSPLEALSYGAQSGGKTMDILRRRQDQQEKRDLEKQYFDNKLAETQEQRRFQQDLLQQKADQDQRRADQEFQRELAKLSLQNEYNRQLQQDKKYNEFDKALQKQEAKNYAEDLAKYRQQEANMSELDGILADMNEVAKDATYTLAGKGIDKFFAQVGHATPGAVARTRFESIANNELFPRLRATLGAQFTENEGKKLLAVMGDPDKTPEEKSAALDEFKKAAQRELNRSKRRLQEYNNFVVPGDMATSGFEKIEENTSGALSNGVKWRKI